MVVKTSVPVRSRAVRRPGQSLACGWCGTKIDLKPLGRPPKWCSSTCRQRAWEQTRAAESGRAAVQVVTSVIEVERSAPPAPALPSLRSSEWADVLQEMAHQIEAGRVYDRDLDSVAAGLDGVLVALQRRPAWTRVLARRGATGRRR